MTARAGAARAGFIARTASRRGVVVTALGLTQILAWGSSYYLPAVLAKPIATETGWPLSWVVGGLSLGLIVAGLASPSIGRAIHRGRARLVLASSSALLGCGLAAMGLAQSLPMYLAAWVVIGLGMGAGLYDAGFATLGRLYLGSARRSIVILTLFGGFASTVCWPFSAILLDQVGWRGACLVYAGIHLLFALPLHVLVVTRGPPPFAGPEADTQGTKRRRLITAEYLPRFLLLAAAASLVGAISTSVAVHLLTLLQAQGLPLAAAVALGAVIGPAQVGARVVEMVFGHRYHPIWTMLAATGLVTIGLALLLIKIPWITVALVLYGAGIGIESIARGTLPLAIFKTEDYAAMIGAIAMPCLIAQALAPLLGALLLEHGGPQFTFSVLAGTAGLSVILVLILKVLCSPRRQFSAAE